MFLQISIPYTSHLFKMPYWPFGSVFIFYLLILIYQHIPYLLICNFWIINTSLTKASWIINGLKIKFAPKILGYDQISPWIFFLSNLPWSIQNDQIYSHLWVLPPHPPRHKSCHIIPDPSLPSTTPCFPTPTPVHKNPSNHNRSGWFWTRKIHILVTGEFYLMLNIIPGLTQLRN